MAVLKAKLQAKMEQSAELDPVQFGELAGALVT
jgi:hypothetical protein